MKYKISLLFFSFFVFAVCINIKAQTVSTYYTFSPDIRYPTNLKIDSVGNCYFMSYNDNWNQQINKLSANGIISTYVSADFYPQSFALDGSGNLFFFTGSTYPAKIKKVTPDGTMSTFISGNYYPQEITFDSSDNLFFLENSIWLPEIKKITPQLTVSSFVSGNYDPRYLAFDKSSNLYFTDSYNSPEIKKVTPDGTVSTYVADNFYPQYLSLDTSGNMFYVDAYNPSEIRKITPDAIISTYANSGISNSNSMTIDKAGTLYLLGNNNGYNVINTIRNPQAACILPEPPVVSNDTAVCPGTSLSLTANGIGELRWYDAPVNGNLVYTGTIFTPLILSDTAFYVEGYYCVSSTSRTVVHISAKALPVPVISGDTTGVDYVALTVSGGISYLWSGGNSDTFADNTFNTSGIYNVTVTNEAGCSAVKSATVTVNRFGVDKAGQLSKDTINLLSEHGELGGSTHLNRNGKIYSSRTDGILNYRVFSIPGACAFNANDLTNLTSASYQTSSGTYSSATLLNWFPWTQLAADGISIPNGGNYFALSVSGYFIPEETGIYTFTCEGDDAVDVFINGVNVANHYSCHPPGYLGTHTGTIKLTQGTRYTFSARMQENTGDEGLQVLWRRPSESSGWHVYSSEITSY